MPLLVCLVSASHVRAADPPYPPSPVIESITWDWDTHCKAAPGSDLWPVTWGPDGSLYVAWGDGGGFRGTNSEARVSMGFARIDGPPDDITAININGGKDSEHPASFPEKGKTGGMLSVDGILYARLNMQNGEWPNVDHSLAWSEDLGATWQTTDWVWPKGDGNFRPTTFLNFGQDCTGVPEHLGDYVFMYGGHQNEPGTVYLTRVPRNRLRDREAYEFLSAVGPGNTPQWSSKVDQATPVFTDTNGASASVNYNAALKRYLLAGYHEGGPGCLGIFDAPEPWGPWTTAAYYDDWGDMAPDGHGLTCNFPQKWMSADGLTIWSIFSVYGDGAKQGIGAHDCFNLVRVRLELR